MIVVPRTFASGISAFDFKGRNSIWTLLVRRFGDGPRYGDSLTNTEVSEVENSVFIYRCYYQCVNVLLFAA